MHWICKTMPTQCYNVGKYYFNGQNKIVCFVFINKFSYFHIFDWKWSCGFTVTVQKSKVFKES